MLLLASLVFMSGALVTLAATALKAVHLVRPRGRSRLDGWVMQRFVAYRNRGASEHGRVLEPDGVVARHRTGRARAFPA